jgi:AraC-like DNA-binding protein
MNTCDRQTVYIALQMAGQRKCSQAFTARAFRSGSGLSSREYDLRLRLGIVDQLTAYIDDDMVDDTKLYVGKRQAPRRRFAGAPEAQDVYDSFRGGSVRTISAPRLRQAVRQSRL